MTALQRKHAYADVQRVYREEVSRGEQRDVVWVKGNSTPIPGAAPRGKTRQGT